MSEAKNGFELHQAEYRFMEVIWDNEPVNYTALVKLCEEQLGWKKSTTYTVLRKMCQRGIVCNEDATVTAIAKREQVQQYESQQVVERSFGGSLPAFVNAFLSEKKLTREEAEQLKKLIEEASR
ncbi:MAG: BlaI/MecI/CopY family transcriptional regulator [Firmicutes bacterium]|nr:BlaI/MecI/CopY family transcriptional regulator [Bacillota bacterium]